LGLVVEPAVLKGLGTIPKSATTVLEDWQRGKSETHWPSAQRHA